MLAMTPICIVGNAKGLWSPVSCYAQYSRATDLGSYTMPEQFLLLQVCLLKFCRCRNSSILYKSQVKLFLNCFLFYDCIAKMDKSNLGVQGDLSF